MALAVALGLWAAVSPASSLAADEALLLEVWVNGASKDVVARVIRKDSHLFLTPADLLHAGVNVNGALTPDGLIPIDEVPGLTVTVDAAAQRLLITASVDRLAPQVVSVRGVPPPVEETSSGFGLVLGYDVSATVADVSRAEKTSALAGSVAVNLFTPWMIVVTDAFAQSEGSRFVRLDSAAEIAEPGVPRKWRVGDSVSGGLAWSRPVRFAGLKVGTDFSLQPGAITFPLPTFFGRAAVPSTADVYVNSVKVFESEFEKGPFELRDLPMVTGRGDVTVVVRDALGRDRSETLSFYVSDQLLARGLSTYDLNAGALRNAYGLRSFDYGDIVFAGTYQYGAADWLTVKAHAEGGAGTWLAGGSAAFPLADIAVAELGGAFSDSRAGTGQLYSAQIQAEYGPVGLFSGITATVGEYADLASLDDVPSPRLRLQAGGSFSLGLNGTLAASWVSEHGRDGKTTKIANATYSVSLGGGWHFGLTGLHDIGSGNWATEAFLSLILGDNLSASASVQVGQPTSSAHASFAQTPNPDGGFGFQVSGGAGDASTQQADVTWIGDRGTVSASVSSAQGKVATRVNASGALVAMDGSLFATRKPTGSIALVRTGRPGVRVYREHREAAVADGDGEAVLTDLVPNAPNHVDVALDDYPFAVPVVRSEREIAPPQSSGVVVDFTPMPATSAIVTVVRSDGSFPAAGSRVWLEGNTQPLVIGHHGQLFLSDLSKPAAGTVEHDLGRCRFSIDKVPAHSEERIAKVGPVVCTEVAANAHQ